MQALHRVFREPINGLTHLGGAVLALAGLVWLIVRTFNTPVALTAAVVYGLSMILLYSASAALHLTKASERVLDWLNRLDHSAIYLLIAGSYTPFCVVLLDGPWRVGMLIAVWTLAAIGITWKLGFYGGQNWLSTGLYLAMGWLSVFIIPQLWTALQAGGTTLGALVLLAVGGVVYSIGAIIFAAQRPNLHRYFGHHELWHVFVLAGSLLHFISVMIIL